MDPSLFPSPPSACMTDPTSAACGAAMEPLCGQKEYYNGAGIADLISPNSNCSAWRSAIMTTNALTKVLSGGSPFLDSAYTAYCTAELTAPECGCRNFPYLPAAKPFCSTTDCGAPTGWCSSDEIAQSDGNGDVMVVEFNNGCTPWYCWMESCFDTNNLIPSDILLSQSKTGVCPGWCIQESHGNTFNGSPPMPPGSFNVQGGGVISQCGNGAVGPTPYMQENTWIWSANSKMQQALAISNDGDLPLDLTVASVSVPWAVLEPAALTVPGRTTQQFVLSADQGVLAAAQAAAPKGIYMTPITLYMSYSEAQGVTQAYASTQKIEVVAAHKPVIRYKDVTPAWFWGVMVGVVLVAILMLLDTLRKREYVKSFIKNHSVKKR